MVQLIIIEATRVLCGQRMHFLLHAHEGTNSMSEDYISEYAVCHIVI